MTVPTETTTDFTLRVSNFVQSRETPCPCPRAGIRGLERWSIMTELCLTFRAKAPLLSSTGSRTASLHREVEMNPAERRGMCRLHKATSTQNSPHCFVSTQHAVGCTGATKYLIKQGLRFNSCFELPELASNALGQDLAVNLRCRSQQSRTRGHTTDGARCWSI
eukprot:1939135-Amphidinium_carterae.1